MGIITDILKDIPLSAVLRERLADQEAKMAALERENAALKAENAVLKADNARLRLENQKAQEQTRALEHQIKQPIVEVHDKILSKEQQEILLLLMKEPTSEDEVVMALGRGAESVKFDLVELEQIRFIERERIPMGEMLCSLTQEGRRHLKAKGFLI